MHVKIRCLWCGKHDADESQRVIDGKGSLCPHCEQDCLGFVDESGNSVKINKATLTAVQIAELAKGKTIDIEQ